MPETWRPVVGFEGAYEVSDLGRVRSLDRVAHRRNGRPYPVRGRVLHPPLRSKGYPFVTLSVDGECCQRDVHALVLEAFVGPCPEGMECCHGDGDKTNDALTNLRWDTSSANNRDIVRHGRNDRTNRTRCPRRHRLVAPNLVACVARRGYRDCLACGRGRNNVAAAARRGVALDFKVEADRHYAEIMEGVADCA